MDWLLVYLIGMTCATFAGAGYFVGWQHGFAARNKIDRKGRSHALD